MRDGPLVYAVEAGWVGDERILLRTTSNPLMSDIAMVHDIGQEWHLRSQQQTGGADLKKTIVSRFGSKIPHQWGQVVPGVKTKLNSTKNVIALTLDACGSRNDSYDSRLITYLLAENIPATLFLNARWIDKFPGESRMLAANSLFEIENHGFAHRACSVTGRSIYGIRGTADIGEVVDEVEKGAAKIESLTKRKPLYYRSGTAHYDDVAAEAITAMGYEIAGFSVLGDAGASLSPEQVRKTLVCVNAGDVVIYHMNRPESGTAEGVIEAAQELLRRGVAFVKLSDCGLSTPPEQMTIR